MWYTTPVALGYVKNGVESAGFTVAGGLKTDISYDGYLYAWSWGSAMSGAGRSFALYPVVALKKDIRDYYDEGTSKWILVDME